MSIAQYVGSVMFGDHFNKIIGHIPLLKFMNDNDKHYDLQYKDGINHDILPFNSSGTCSKGGIYITTVEYWSSYIYSYGKYAREVRIPDDAYVFIESLSKFKCSQIWLGIREEKIKLVEYMFDKYIKASKSQDVIHKILSIDINTIYHINPEHIGIETLTKIIKTNGFYLEMMLGVINPLNLNLNQIQGLFLEAVKQNGLSLKLIPRELRTFEILLFAIKQNGLSLEYIDPCDQTYRLQMEAVKQTGHAIKYIRQESRNRDIIKLALKTPDTLKYLGNYGNYD